MLTGDSWDVVIVGAGIIGTWVAKELAEAGLSVALLDAGPLPNKPAGACDSDWTRKRARLAGRQPVQSRHPAYWMQDPTYYVDDLDHPYRVSGEEGFVWIRGRQVGGRSLTWGGVTLRFSEFELDAPRHDGFGPAWPLSYRDLEANYARVESFMGVQGSRDSLQALPDGHFCGEPELTPAEVSFRQLVEKRWPDRRVIGCRAIPESVANEGWPQRSTLHRLLPEAVRTGRVQVLPDSIASSLLMDEVRDRVLGVSCVHRRTHDKHIVRGRALALCASTIETLRILLNSASERHPTGVANSSGCLGRFLIDHTATLMAGPMPQSVAPPVGQSIRGSGVLIPRFRNLHQRNASGFIRGYGLWGRMGHALWEDTPHPLWSLCAMGEVLPRAENRVEIDSAIRDAWGIPVARIRLGYSGNEREMAADAERVMREMAQAAGWPVALQERMPPGAFVHELGGARVGDNPRHSVLNSWCQSWDVSNLFVLDGACFVTSGWQNPTLTMIALALRGAGHLSRELEAGHL